MRLNTHSIFLICSIMRCTIAYTELRYENCVLYIDIKCSGNLTQNHAGIHGPFKDIFQCHIQLRFSKKRPRRSNKIMAQKCTTIIAQISAIYSFGHISFGQSQTIYGRNGLSHISFSPKRLLPYTKGNAVLVLH
jgi:hypothetical protein